MNNKNDNNLINVFITGGTGFVGSHLITRLLIEEKYRVFCLVRPTNEDSTERLISAVLTSAEMSNIPSDVILKKTGNIKSINGSLTKPLLGISDVDIKILTDSNIAHIWHIGAFLNFEEAFREEVFQQNAEGTGNVIELAKLLKIDAFNYFSTAYVAGSRSGNIPETYCDNNFKANNPYEESKRLAESLIISASQENSFHARIFRPSIVIGNSNTYQTSSDASFYGFLHGLDIFVEWIKERMPDYFENNQFIIYRETDATINMVPVDIVVDEAIAISNEKNISPEFHHLTNPFATAIDTVLPALKNSFPGVDFVPSNNNDALQTMDKIFQDKLYYYTPYLMNNKIFGRRKNIDHLNDKLKFGKSTITKYIDAYVNTLHNAKIKRKRKSKKVLEILNKKSINCRLGKQLTYYKIGNGPALVLINAYAVGLQAWKWIISAFSSNYNIITWECRGLLNSNDSSFNFTVEEHSNDLKEILSSEGIEQAHIVSWCSGGKIALKFLDDNPSYVKSLTFLAGSFYPLNGYKEILTKWDQNIITMADSLNDNPGLAGIYMKSLSDIFNNNLSQNKTNNQMMDDIVSFISPKYQGLIMSPFLNENAIINYGKLVRNFFRYDISDYLDKVDVPTFVISAQNDEIAHPEQSKIIAEKIKNAKSLCLPAATHWLLMENGEEIVKELDTFFHTV